MDVAVSACDCCQFAGDCHCCILRKPHISGVQWRVQKRGFRFCSHGRADGATLPISLLVAAALSRLGKARAPVFIYSSERTRIRAGKPFRAESYARWLQDLCPSVVKHMDKQNECDGSCSSAEGRPADNADRFANCARRIDERWGHTFIKGLRREMSVVGPRPVFHMGAGGNLRRFLSAGFLVKPGINWSVGRSMADSDLFMG